MSKNNSLKPLLSARNVKCGFPFVFVWHGSHNLIGEQSEVDNTVVFCINIVMKAKCAKSNSLCPMTGQMYLVHIRHLQKISSISQLKSRLMLLKLYSSLRCFDSIDFVVFVSIASVFPV